MLDTLEKKVLYKFTARIMDYVTKFPGELKRILAAFATLTTDLPVDSKWMRHGRLYFSLRELHVLLFGAPPPMCKQMWDLQENIRVRILDDLAPIRGGFAEETIRELANPDTMSNLQLSKLVTDIVPGRNKRKSRNKKAREARLRDKFGEEYVTKTDRRRAQQRKIALVEVRDFKEAKKQALNQVLPVPTAVAKRKTTWKEFKERRGTKVQGAVPHTVTSGDLERTLNPEDLRNKLNRSLVPQAEASYDKSSRKQTGRGFGARKGRDAQDMEQVYRAMTDEEKREYLKSAVPAGWGLEFMAVRQEEDDIPLQIHWEECQESLDL